MLLFIGARSLLDLAVRSLGAVGVFCWENTALLVLGPFPCLSPVGQPIPEALVRTSERVRDRTKETVRLLLSISFPIASLNLISRRRAPYAPAEALLLASYSQTSLLVLGYGASAARHLTRYLVRHTGIQLVDCASLLDAWHYLRLYLLFLQFPKIVRS